MSGRILVADAADNVRRFIVRHYGVKVVEAETFFQARDLLIEGGIALLVAELLDVTQTSYKIDDLVKDARASRQWYLPIIIFTGESVREEVVQVAQRLKPDAVISKGPMGRLFRSIDRLLNDPTAYKECPLFDFERGTQRQIPAFKSTY